MGRNARHPTVAVNAFRAISGGNPKETRVSTSVSFTGAALDALLLPVPVLGSSISDNQRQHAT